LRWLGFRRLLAGTACLAAAVTAGCGLLRPDTPVWLIVFLVLSSGCLRSIQYLGLNAISYADVPAADLSKSTGVAGVAQQLARGFGIAVGAALLAVIAGPRTLTIGDFHLAFFLIAMCPLLSALGFLRLSPADGAEVSGHRRTLRPA
jgi:Na+/melibiose symporter-like transporter